MLIFSPAQMTYLMGLEEESKDIDGFQFLRDWWQ